MPIGLAAPGPKSEGHFQPAAVALACSFPIDQDIGKSPHLTLRFSRTHQGTLASRERVRLHLHGPGKGWCLCLG
jgi:hypothetical protein